MGVAPDGLNINHDCGATSPQALQGVMADANADLGIALDGDADRLILCDETGRVCDGDQILAALALDMQERGVLNGPVIGTLMSNLGLERLLAERGIGFERTAVGDRYIMERMLATGASLGGEPSGHILLPHLSRTGDGLIAALQILSILSRTGRRASEILSPFIPVPQKLVNIKNVDKAVLNHKAVTNAVAEAEAELGDEGRVLLRPSGTEPLIRVMVEALDETALDKAMAHLTETISAHADPAS